MHLRYDLKNKLDFQKFSLQGNYFLNKEDCVFSFYLVDFAISFNIIKDTDNNSYYMNYSLSEICKPNANGDAYYQNIAFFQDPRFRELFFVKELKDSPTGHINKASSVEIVNSIMLIVKALSKLNKLTFAI